MLFQVKIIQLAINDHESRSDRFKRVENYLSQIYAEAKKPLVVMLPEIWATGFFNFDLYRRECEHLEGETYARLAPWAEKIGSYIIAGSIIEKEGNDLYNTALLINPDGSLAGSYRKIHLFGFKSKETEMLTAGSDIYLLKTEQGTWGLSICYDLRFPELYRKMSEEGVDLFFVVSAWPGARIGHWELFNRVRALENLSYLASCNCAGRLKGCTFGGKSMVVDPWGDIIARAGENEEMLTAEIDPGKVAAVRSEFTALKDRQIF